MEIRNKPAKTNLVTIILIFFFFLKQRTILVEIIVLVYIKLVANSCDARESYQFFPNDVTLAIGI